MVETNQRRADAAGQQQWAEAFAAYERAEAAYRPIREAFDRMERHRAALAKLRNDVPEAEIAKLNREIAWEEVKANEGHYLGLHCAALRALLATPARDLTAVICKLELSGDHGWDEDAESIILADLKRLHLSFSGGRS